MTDVVWRREAAEDLTAITEYIAKDDPVASEKMGRRLVRLGDSLADFPHRGGPAEDDTREMVTVPPYVLVYRVENDTISILRIRHGRQRR